jgi:beta-glucosidase
MTVKKSIIHKRFGWLCHQTFKRVKGFQKIILRKGEKKTVTLKFYVEDLKFYNSDLEFVAEPGQFDVYIGASLMQIRKLVLS